MDRVRQRKWVAKAGGQVPKHVAKMMRQLHPNVSLLWHNQLHRWCLVQSVRGVDVLIRMLGTKERFEPPTITNTVYFLNAAHPSNFKDRFDQERLLKGLDESSVAAAVKMRSRERIREGSKDIFNVLSGRRVFARP